jgi:hypothetical protein
MVPSWQQATPAKVLNQSSERGIKKYSFFEEAPRYARSQNLLPDMRIPKTPRTLTIKNLTASSLVAILTRQCHPSLPQPFSLNLKPPRMTEALGSAQNPRKQK